MNIKPPSSKGLQFTRYFTRDGISPFDLFEYDYRTSLIRDTKGEIVFQMDNVEVPNQWSQIATDILAQKYFRKAGVPLPDGSTGRETSVKQVAHRMAYCWKVWGERNNYFATGTDAQIFYEELVYCILNQSCVPNSPQWFNTGLHEVYGIEGKPQGHYYVDASDERHFIFIIKDPEVNYFFAKPIYIITCICIFNTYKYQQTPINRSFAQAVNNNLCFRNSLHYCSHETLRLMK